MAKVPNKIRVTAEITHTNTVDRWAAKKEQLSLLSNEQAIADITLVEAQREHARATNALNQAVASKTTAEKRLASFRATLGAE